jgi:hypothetical protein
LRHDNLAASGLEQADGREADPRPHQVNETSDEKADAHFREKRDR